MFTAEVDPQFIVRIVEMIFSVGITEMAEEMILPQMLKQLIPVKVSFFTELTKRMSSMRRVVPIALPLVISKIRSRVVLSFPTKKLDILNAEVTGEQVMSSLHMGP
jgi:hypothetical protein